jgi:transcriptional regulator with XRE-family HTH domain
MPLKKGILKSLRGDMRGVVAKALDVITTIISQWEAGARTPTMKNFEVLSAFFRTPIADFRDTAGTLNGKYIILWKMHF